MLPYIVKMVQDSEITTEYDYDGLNRLTKVIRAKGRGYEEGC